MSQKVRPKVDKSTEERLNELAEEQFPIDPSGIAFGQKVSVLLDELEEHRRMRDKWG
jgi:hypothetical protein